MAGSIVSLHPWREEAAGQGARQIRSLGGPHGFHLKSPKGASKQDRIPQGHQIDSKMYCVLSSRTLFAAVHILFAAIPMRPRISGR
jgi:hypothetical protein